MTAYYNEFDPFAAAWLRELIKANLIAPGDVDERSIKDVRPEDLRGYGQCHFFAGVGGWSYALRLAGIRDDEPIWTGSCPCQPFSAAGKQKAQADERHLWPDFFRLIAACKPELVLGEQVEGAIRHGWLDGVFADLEGEGYACGAAVLGAHSVGAPHIRQRLWWVAHSKHGRSAEQEQGAKSWRQGGGMARLEHSSGYGREPRRAESDGRIAVGGCSAGWMVLSDCCGHRPRGETASASRFWDSFDTASCFDGKTRRVPTEPAFQPLAHGIPARVGRLRGYGNAIVPQVAATFIQASLEARDERAASSSK